jgi:hypothetical protein
VSRKKDKGEECGGSIASEVEDVYGEAREYDLMVSFNNSLGISQQQTADSNSGPVISGSNLLGSRESRNENLTYMYSLDDGLASPNSLSQQGMSPMSNQLQNQIPRWADGEVPSSQIRMDIVAPPGKLGIIIDTCSEGTPGLSLLLF